VFPIEGGHEYDGRPIVPFDERGMRNAARRIRESGLRSVAVASVFSPLKSDCEERAREILEDECEGVDVTLSKDVGRIGLLGRENATLLNAAIIELARRTTSAFVESLKKSGIEAPLFLTQNDGTVLRAEIAEKFPVFGFASGPTNSMRGAAFLSGLDDALVVDVGGTTSDVGCLKAGFPREANNVVEVGGVRTLFRMPDLLSIGLGGGSLVEQGGDGIIRVGPRSVGYRLTEKALVFGGDTLTATDVAVALGLADLGDRRRAQVDRATLESARTTMASMLEEAVDRMKTDAAPEPLIAVGGGAFLVPETMAGISEVVHVKHQGVANAVGAAIAQVSGEVDQVFSGVGREEAISRATALAREKAVSGGASAESLRVVEVEDLPLAYLPGDALRVRVRVVGDAATAGR
jgi:N-methylhydantoinase A/oxoprolinase/acetone carboxylase beta subunit